MTEKHSSAFNKQSPNAPQDVTSADRLATTIIKARYLTLLATVAIFYVCFLGLKNITFTTDYRIFFSHDNPHMLAFENLQETYTKDDSLLFVIESKQGNVFEQKTLSMIEKITEDGWTVPYSSRVDSVTNYQHTYAEEDDLIVGNLIEYADELTEQDFRNAEQIALAEPILKDRIVSEDSRVTAVNVTVRLPGINKVKEVPEIVSQGREMIEQYRAEYGDIANFYLAGSVINNNAFKESSINDLTSLIPLAMLLAILGIAIYMFYASRSLLTTITGTLATVVIIVASIWTAEGVAGWLGINLSPPAANAPTMILTLAIADSIHILVSFFLASQKGLNKREAVKESLRLNFQPVFLTSLTTMIGFLTLNFSDSPPFRDMGNVVAIGVIFAWIYSIVLLPALIMILPFKVKVTKKAELPMMQKIANKTIQHYKSILIGVLAVIIGFGAFVPKNELYDVWAEYFDESMPVRQAIDFTQFNLTGVATVEYSLSANEENGVTNPEYLEGLEKYTNWLEAQPEVAHVNSFIHVMKRLNKNMHGDDPAWYKVPDDRELAAQYLLLYEISLPFGLDLNNQVNIDKSATRVVVSIHRLSTVDLLAFADRAHLWMKENLPEYMVDQGSSRDIMFAHIGERNINSMLQGTAMAIVLISLVLAIALKSYQYGLLSLLPNIAPAAIAFGIWGIVSGRVGVSLSIVTCMTLGIVVDYTVHLLSKYLRAKREQGLSTDDAIRYAFDTVGVALIVTTAILCVNFGILALSDFSMNSQMGLMTAMTILIALIIDFLFLPALLKYLSERQKNRKGVSSTDATAHTDTTDNNQNNKSNQSQSQPLKKESEHEPA
ncbi:efflux RND transporter permease subunit [Litoribacillus peritrichatus]|uniref:MMPL family transporter n=1 Tax=Litoribacillus peritrichatus TaxID=718191 RepID=A0ABP7NAR0_9GAMM